MGVGRREAFGVRQLAAALSYAQTTCLEPDQHDAENNVSVPISASFDLAADPTVF
ncbi:MAG: hypothetical protein GX456_03945 [Verrucomicrobia bacterium]|nr:hypothetical protein [Verrucomicrobiota bacterium]